MRTSIVPFATSSNDARTSSWIQTLVRYLDHGASGFKRAWIDMQVSHRGKYSIERLLALEEYTRTTSLTRVLLVCVGTPLPIIIVVISQEALPLANPAAGWRVNWGFWVRVCVLGGMTSLGIFTHLKTVIGGVKVSTNQIIIQFILMAISYGAVSILIAALVLFPIPYMVILMATPLMLLFTGSVRVVLGKRQFYSILEKKYELKRFASTISVPLLMTVIYPAYQVLFNSVEGSLYELPVFLLLPLIKFVLKHLVALSLVDLPELIPQNIIFTVNFFNALYLVTCMQSSSSIFAVAIVMAIDLVETGLALMDIYHSTTRIMLQLHQTIGPSSKTSTLLDAAFSLCHCHDKFTEEERKQIRVRSILQHSLSTRANEILARIDNNTVRLGPTLHRSPNTQSMPTMANVADAMRPSRLNLLFSYQLRPKIKPIPIDGIQVNKLNCTHNIQAVAAVPSVLHLATLRKSLAALFTMECMVLAEYVEFVIPLLYGSYVLIMVHLPSAQYHTELTGVTRENVHSMVQNIFIYGTLELGSFLLFILIMKRSCGMEALYHLAFVLENEVMSIQSKMMGWMLMTLGFRIVHFGVDLTFQFEWIRDQW